MTMIIMMMMGAITVILVILWTTSCPKAYNVVTQMYLWDTIRRYNKSYEHNSWGNIHQQLTMDMKAINHVTKAAPTVWWKRDFNVSNTMYAHLLFTEHDIKYSQHHSYHQDLQPWGEESTEDRVCEWKWKKHHKSYHYVAQNELIRWFIPYESPILHLWICLTHLHTKTSVQLQMLSLFPELRQSKALGFGSFQRDRQLKKKRYYLEMNYMIHIIHSTLLT